MSELFMLVNASACLVIMLRLMYFNKFNKGHNLYAALTAYGMIICAGFIFFHILSGQYLHIEPAESLFNVIIAILLIRSKGNVSRFLKGKNNGSLTERH